jgi:hypothetical protein
MAPLHLAVKLEKLQAVNALLSDKNVDVNVQNDVFY